jgi:hypothetical protein
MAQVYSVNAVGYVKAPAAAGIPAGNYAILANPLNGTNNNNINAIMPLATDGSQDGTTVLRWNPATQSFGDGLQWVGGAGVWFDPATSDVSNAQLQPGEGFFVQNVGSAPLQITFVGEVPQGSLSTPIVGGNNYSLKASQVPQAARLGRPGSAGTLEFPADDGDTVLIWDVPTQTYLEGYTYIQDAASWFSNTDPAAIPDGPLISPGQGFFVQNNGGDSNWTRNFSVNP